MNTHNKAGLLKAIVFDFCLMSEPSEYRVEWGKVARTIVYYDSEGQVTFSLDGSHKGTHWITLEHLAPQTSRPPRYGIAFDRVHRFLESCGFQVEICGEASEPKVSLGRDLQTLLYEDSQGKLVFHFNIVSDKDSMIKHSTLRFSHCEVFTSDARIIECKTSEEEERFAFALEKVREYLKSHGYQIET